MTIEPIQVTLDAGPAVHQRAGLSRYTERLAAHLLGHEQERLSLSLFYNAHSGHSLPPSLATAPVRTVALGQLRWRLSVLATQLLRWPRYEQLLPGGHLYHATEHLLPYLHRPTVLTVHDLIFERYPAHHTRRNRLFLQLAMPRFVAAAHAIIAVSQHTKADLVELYGTDPAKIHVIYQGIDPTFAPADPATVQRVGRQYSPGEAEGAVRPYLLMVGTLEPRKNHATAMRALARLKAQGFSHRLLIVGGEGWLFAPIQALVGELGLAGDVTFAGYVPFADLVGLYSGADAVLVPSLYEGFGFPVLEAMACGAPVVCSTASSLPEVAAEAALLVPPTDDEALAAAIVQLLTDTASRNRLREAGRQRARQFRWEQCAAQTVDLYLHVLAQTASRHLLGKKA
jgi:glycosyltransferase involved in cell wall biosynthesis